MPINIGEVSYTLELPGVPADIRKEIGNLLVEEIKNDLSNQTSPVTGDPFDPLSVNYAKYKKAKKGNDKANLFLEGDMQDAIKSKLVKDGVQIYISKAKEVPKAFNHNVGDTTKARPFIPDEDLGQSFRPEIMEKINDLIPTEEIEAEDFVTIEREDEEEVSTKILLSDAFIRKLINGD